MNQNKVPGDGEQPPRIRYEAKPIRDNAVPTSTNETRRKIYDKAITTKLCDSDLWEKR